MNPSTKVLTFLAIGIVSFCLIVFLCPLFLDSKIDRVFEDDLPRVSIENETEIYCRMQADDFRFQLPKVGVLSQPYIAASSFDSIQGYLIVSFPTNPISPEAYEALIPKDIQAGGFVSVSQRVHSHDLLVKFSYFGDK